MRIQHFSHHHPLGLWEHKGIFIEEMNCNGCEQLIASGTQIYGCKTCKYYLHKSCGELEIEEIHNHPFHPNHNLTFRARAPNEWGKFECGACEKQDCSGFLYRCHECDFNLEYQCAKSPKPVAINLPRAHEHLLVFLNKNKRHANMCDCCRKYSYGPFFKCMSCKFNIKLDCFPFPRVVKIKYHRHQLIFSDPLTEEQEAVGEDEIFYCDACEEERDPKEPVYCCRKCNNFTAHQLCGLTQYEYKVDENWSLALKLEDLKLESDAKSETCKLVNVELESGGKTNEEEIKPTFTLTSFSRSILEEEIHEKDHSEELKNVFKALKSDKVGFKDIFNISTDNDLEASLYRTMAFRKFMTRFENYTQSATLDLKNIYITPEIVEVCNYKISKNLAPTLESLFAKCGDITEESTLSPKAKTCIVNNLCGAIYSMQNTNFVKLSGESSLIFSWWLSFKYAHHGGFKVGFVVAHLKRLMRLQLGVRVKASSNLNVEDIDRRSAEIQLKLQKLKEDRAKLVATERSKFREVWFHEGLELKMDYALTGLL